MKATIVLGLGFGDEGKGVTTNSLITSTDANDTIVVRFSGGQQAGHTVIENGIKHVHSSYGSGTLQSIPTYISEHCTLNPESMYKEHTELVKKKVKVPLIKIHPLAKLTTPFDVDANRSDLKNIGDGSCGMGVGKTMKRNEGPYKLYAIDMLSPKVLREKLDNIAKYYADLNSTPVLWSAVDEAVDKYIKAINDLPFVIGDYRSLGLYRHIIFEGSQGILLDMDHGFFPNVTYANTTSKNALDICQKIGIQEESIEIYYVTRTYQTRHGNGWMSDQRDLDLINNEEEINVTNEYQGEFKTGNLDYDLIDYAIKVDSIYSNNIVDKHIMVTCMDQIPGFEFSDPRLSRFKIHYRDKP